MRLIMGLILFIQFSVAYEIEHFLLPKDGNKAEQSLITDILNAKHSVDVAMFMVTNKKLTNALKKRAKQGKVVIRLLADKSYDVAHKKISKVKNLVDKKNISLFHINGLKKKKKKFGIMHAKLVIIDDNITYIGSTNWTKSAFHSNYEILLKIVDKTTAKLYQYYFSDMLANTIHYK